MNCCNGADTPRVENFVFVRGDTWAWNTRVLFDGEPAMMDEDSRVTLYLKRDGYAFRKVYRSDAQDEDGYVNVFLLPSETETLEPTKYKYELEFYLSEEKNKTALCGEITVLADMITPDVRGNGDA